LHTFQSIYGKFNIELKCKEIKDKKIKFLTVMAIPILLNCSENWSQIIGQQQDTGVGDGTSAPHQNLKNPTGVAIHNKKIITNILPE
jgi:hypothetical protein